MLNVLNMSGIFPLNMRWSRYVTQVSSNHSHLSHSQLKMVINMLPLAQQFFVHHVVQRGFLMCFSPYILES